MYDILIIGAGPAGISAAIYAKSRGCNVLVLEQSQIGGQISMVSNVTHYCGLMEEESGTTFANRLKQQANDANIEIQFEQVIQVKLQGERKEVQTTSHTYQAKKIILANGTTPRKLHIPGEKELYKKGIVLNAFQDGQDYAQKHVYVVGGSDGAAKEALYLSKLASKVTILHFEEALGCIQEFKQKILETSNIEVCLQTRLHAVYGKEQVEGLDLLNLKDNTIKHVEESGCGIFVYAGSIPNTSCYTELELENGYIPVDKNQQTKIPGVYAAGDICVKQVRQIATAVSDGAIAGIHAATH